ncbi:TetR/AcrR family transcriptional regulator [Sorangium sp. So ce1153]|uniref:TetR/AcrR family transcriptional regulator n=1 Tax=Sorangium sp. So ce1153 TaxID=3133333 RepID=UPI003F61FB81
MPRPSNTAERRAQIARALLKTMAERGYEGASVGAIAAAAQIAPGLVHYHFESKREILLAAVELLAQDHAERLERLLAAAGDDPAAELRAFIDAHLRAGDSADPQALACWICVSGEALRDAGVRAAFAGALEDAVRRLVAILRRGARARVFSLPRAEVDAAAAAIVAAIQGYFVLAATARELIPPGSAASATWAMASGLLGLSSSTSSTRKASR